VPVVTALRATRRGGVALHVDGEYLCVVSESLVARWRLFKGRELATADLDELRAAASAERVTGDAHRLLGHRARSADELRRRLLAKGHDEAAVERAVERLTADGLLDDAEFARSFAADKRRLSGWGTERIRRDLRRLGVDAPVVDAALGEGGDDDLELERALAVLRKRGAPQQPLEADRRRAFDALRRRGFSTSTAYAAIRLWAGER
jgi:regulatory protein